MKKLTLSLLCCIPLLVASATAVAGNSNQLSIGLGIDQGGLVLGGDFLVKDTATESLGAYTRLYSKDEDQGAPALFALGGAVRGHVKSGIFEYYLSPGFGLLHHNLRDSELLFGPTLTYGLTADLDTHVGLGVENTKLYSWIGEYKGLIKDTFLAHVRFRL